MESTSKSQPTLERVPGLRPLPWPPFKGRETNPRALGGLAGAWAASFVLAVVLGFLAKHHHWNNYPVGDWRLGFYPPWTISILWALWFGWAYGATIAALSGLILALAVPPALGFPGALLWGAADALGIWITCRIMYGFPVDTRVRTLRDAALFGMAVFLGAIASANGAFVEGFAGRLSPNEALQRWESWWLGHFVECLVLTGPLVTLAGVQVERWKARHFDCPPQAGTFRRQVLGVLLGGLALVLFYSVWMQAAGARMTEDLERWVTDSDARRRLLDSYQDVSLHRGVVMATLLGLLGVGAWMVLVLRRRFELQLDSQFQHAAALLQRRQQHLRLARQIAEEANTSPGAAEFAQWLAERFQRAYAPCTVSVYVRDTRNAAFLNTLSRAATGRSDTERVTRFPVTGSLPGRVVLQREMVQARTETEPELANHAEALDLSGIQSYFGVPVETPAGCQGVIEVLVSRQIFFDEDDRASLRLAGRALGALLERGGSGTLLPGVPGDLAILYRLSQDLAEAPDADLVLRRTAEAARQIAASAEAAVFTEKADNGRTTFAIVAHTTDGSVSADRIGQQIAQADAGLVQDCLRKEQTVAAGLADLQAPEQALTSDWKAAAAVALPIDAGKDEPRRVLALAFSGKPAADEILEKAGEVARMAGAGLRRLRLFEELRQQTAELALIEQMGRALSEHLSIDETLGTLVSNARNVVRADWCSVFEYDAEARDLVMRSTTVPHPDAPSIRIPITAQSIVATCLREGRLLVSSDLVNDPRSSPVMNEKYGSRSGMVAPLGPTGSRFGVFFATNPEQYTYSQVEMRRFEQLAALASAAIERARLYEEVQRRAEELALLNEAGAVLVEQTSLEASLHAIAEVVRRHFHAVGAGFLLKDKDKEELVVAGAAGPGTEKVQKLRVNLSEHGVITQAFREQRSFSIEDNRTDPKAGRILDEVLPNMRSGAVVPMRGTQQPVGILGLFDEKVRRFTADDLRRLEAVGRLAAAAVERGALGEALRQTEARIREILDATPAVVIGVGLDGRILSFNATAERLTGYKREEAVGRNCMELLYPEPVERARVEHLLSESFRTGRTGTGQSTTLVTRDGRPRKIRWSGESLLDAEGKMAGVVGMGIDVTEQSQLEEQFLQAQKMESVGALAGGMAHDFNNLLGGILGQAALAHGQLRSTDPVHAILKKIEAAAKRGADLTTKLLAFARRQVIQPIPVDVGLLLRETAELLAGSLPKEITVISQTTPGLPKVEGDPTQLQQVLLNLCVNARDAMPKGGTLTLKAMPGLAGDVRIEIHDTGQGFSEEAKAHLFEPFFTTKEKGKGTGLGLAVVFGIVRSHNGRIELESAPGAGSCFVIHLPAMQKSGTEARATATGADAVADQLRLHGEYAGTEEILLVDDEPMVRETTEKLLQVFGYRVTAAADGEDALRRLDAGEAKPQIVVLDVVMPGLAGVRLLEEIRKRLPAAPVILISGYSRDLEVRRMLEAGALELIQKPFQIDELAGAVRRALHGKAGAK